MATSPATVFAQQSGPIGFADIRVCEPGRIDVPQVLRDAPGGSPDEQPITIEADGIETDTVQRLILTGNAQVVQGKRGIYAERIEYDQEAYRARASGDVIYYTTGGDEIKADAMDIEVDTFIGDADNVSIKMVDTQPEFLVRSSEKFDEDYSVFAPLTRQVVTVDEPEDVDDEADNEDSPKKKKEKVYYQRARAKAETMDIRGQGLEVLENAVMTTCPDGNQDVTLSASQMELDHVSGIGNAKNMVVRLKNVPIFYFPTVTFPINDERKTGFLFPAIGNENDSGFTLETPYYINIAPQMDATVTPRLLTNRGVQIYSEFRYKATETDGAVRVEYLPGDDVYENEDRYAIGFDHQQTFADDWRFQAEIQDVSDVDYMRDFANNVDIIASSYIPQRATLSRTGEYINFNAKVQSFESVNDQILDSQLPYDILPAVNLNVKSQEIGLFEAGMKNNFTQFEANDNTRVTGSRALLNPYVSMPLEKIYGYIRPKVSLHQISYSLDNPVDDSLEMEMAADDSPSASIPVFSVDSQVVFERLFTSGDTPYYQTLEPRLFYLNVPKETDQNAFPDFDTGETIPSSFGHFFRENRFFGGDRVGDTEQLTLGLSSRIINDDNGSQRMMFSLGQIFYLKDREIKLDPEAEPDTNNKSDFIGEITANITDDWSMSGFGLYDNEESELGVIRASANYFNSPRRNASISYTDVRDSYEQVNLGFETPLGPTWQLDVDTAYSLTDSELRSSAIGITYDGCCWAVKATTQRFLDGRGEFNNRFLLTLELDDLGRIRGGL